MIIAKTNKKRFLEAAVYLPNIDSNQTIARYFTPRNIRLLAQQQALYFHPVDQYRIDYGQDNEGDPNENKAPEAQYAGSWPRDNPRQRKVHERIHEIKKGQVKPYVSCWTMFDCEDEKMWAEYGREPGSVCIISTVGDVLSALSSANVYAKAIDYIPKDSFEPYAHESYRKRIEGSLFSFPDLELKDVVLDCFLKTSDHQWEKEVRFAIFSEKDLNGSERLVAVNNIGNLVNRIILSPQYDQTACLGRSDLNRMFRVSAENSEIHSNIFNDRSALV